MKKLVLFAGVLGMISLTSCKKDWDCECTLNDGSTDTTTISNAKKADAEAACDALELGGLLGSCELK